EQFNTEEWDKHWAILVSAQQQLISASEYAACRVQGVTPEFNWVKLVSTTPNVETRIPGTSLTQPSTEVVARFKLGEATLPVTAHMFYEQGTWRWSMSQENLDGCGVTSATSSDSEPALTVVESGFGQRDEYVWVTAVVRDDGQAAGRFITANFNLLDASGEILESETQVEQMTWDGQELVLGTQVALDSAKTKVASIEVDTVISDNSDNTSDRARFTTGKVKISKSPYGGYTA
ncbi:MAG: hypothetical protein REI45_13090, partial [Propionicimonas sp.]|nr:hypothetical protein [Propionicimonas sp.]